MNDIQEFFDQVDKRVESYPKNNELIQSSKEFMKQTIDVQYSYNFTWMGLPIIQYPQDIVAMQELIFKVEPDLIIETGIARGGSLIFYSSMIELLNNGGKVLGVDVDIREHNKDKIISHPMYKNIEMLEGSSISDEIFSKVVERTKGKNSVLVVLDSNHTHEHVLKELQLYSSLVTKGSYCVVFDTIIEDLPSSTYQNRPWDVGNNPKSAVYEFLKNNREFAIDKKINNKLLVSVAPDGFLQKEF